KGTLAIYNYTIPKIIEFQYSINFFVTGSEDYPERLIKPFSEVYLLNDNLKLLVDYYTEIYLNDNLKFYTKRQVSNDSSSYLVSKGIIKASALELCSEYFGSELTHSDLDLKDRLPLAEIWETKFQTRSYENFFPVQKIL
ncbi:4114_t:CDS:2, partial [Dentiscutata heterogama]